MNTLRTPVGIENPEGLDPDFQLHVVETVRKFRQPIHQLFVLTGVIDISSDLIEVLMTKMLAANEKEVRQDRPVRKWVFEELVNLSVAELGAETDGSLAFCRLAKHFQLMWRTQILNHAWKRLEQIQNETAQPCFSVCKIRYENPDIPSEQLMKEVLEAFRTIPTKQAFRAFLYHSEICFAKAVVNEVASTLWSNAHLTMELKELGLVEFLESMNREQHRKRQWVVALQNARRNFDF